MTRRRTIPVPRARPFAVLVARDPRSPPKTTPGLRAARPERASSRSRRRLRIRRRSMPRRDAASGGASGAARSGGRERGPAGRAGPDPRRRSRRIPTSSTPGRITPTGVQSVGIFKSTDGGASWIEANVGLFDPFTQIEPLDVPALSIDPTNPQVLLAGTRFSEIFRSSDGGANWTRRRSADPASASRRPVSRGTPPIPSGSTRPRARASCSRRTAARTGTSSATPASRSSRSRSIPPLRRPCGPETSTISASAAARTPERPGSPRTATSRRSRSTAWTSSRRSAPWPSRRTARPSISRRRPPASSRASTAARTGRRSRPG